EIVLERAPVGRVTQDCLELIRGKHKRDGVEAITAVVVDVAGRWSWPPRGHNRVVPAACEDIKIVEIPAGQIDIFRIEIAEAERALVEKNIGRYDHSARQGPIVVNREGKGPVKVAGRRIPGNIV